MENLPNKMEPSRTLPSLLFLHPVQDLYKRMQRRLTKKLSETLRREQLQHAAVEPLIDRPPSRRSPRQTQNQEQPNEEPVDRPSSRRPPRPTLQTQNQEQDQYNSQSFRRTSPGPSNFFELPEEVIVPEESRPRSRNAAFLNSVEQSRQSVSPRGKSQTGSSRSTESTRQAQARSGSEPPRPPAWRSDFDTLGPDESSEVLSTASEDFSEDYDVDPDAGEDFVQNSNIVSSEILVDDDGYEEDYEPTAPVSRKSSRTPRQPAKQSTSEERSRKSPKKSSKPEPVHKKQSKSKSITFRDTNVKRDSSRSKYTRSSEGDDNCIEGRSGSSSSRRGRVPSMTGTQVTPRGSQTLAGASMSREVMALPIEIPESVTDADAFRRYLSVRRGATIGLVHPTLLPFEDHVGGSGLRAGRTATNLNAQMTQGMAIHRRTVALSHAIMTLALLSASSAQLRFVVACSNAHSYPALNYFLICSCIIIEIIVGIGYVVVSRVDFSDSALEKVHSYLIFGLFFVAISNVILASFALDDHLCEVLALAKKTEQYDNLEPLPPLQSQSQPQSLSQSQPQQPLQTSL